MWLGEPNEKEHKGKGRRWFSAPYEIIILCSLMLICFWVKKWIYRLKSIYIPLIYPFVPFSWNSQSTWARLTSPSKPLSWQQTSHWQRKPSVTKIFTHLGPFQYLNGSGKAASLCALAPRISEQPDLVPVTALAKVVIELPLSVSGWARPRRLCFHTHMHTHIGLLWILVKAYSLLQVSGTVWVHTQLYDLLTCSFFPLQNCWASSAVLQWVRKRWERHEKPGGHRQSCWFWVCGKKQVFFFLCVCVQVRSSAFSVGGTAHFASCLRLPTLVRNCRPSARPSLTSFGPMSCSMGNGSSIRPAWSSMTLQTRAAPHPGPWILWDCTAPPLQESLLSITK